MSGVSDKLIVALDVPSLAEAKHFIDALYPEVKMFKIGIQLFTACGPQALAPVIDKGGRVFLDLKFHDIPNTVYQAAAAATALGASLLTVHTKGGSRMLEEAARAAREKSQELKIPKPAVVGVTRLTSDADTGDIESQVLESAEIARAAGLDGVVCAVTEAALIRREMGKHFIIVTPGIRPQGAAAGDQKRTGTAAQALDAGADFIVVGRPILQAKDPLAAVRGLL